MKIEKYANYTFLNEATEALTNTDKIKLDFCEESANYLIHKNVIIKKNTKRLYNSSTKTRSEVRGGGSKPWRQKGTGRARAGSNRSPLWKGGGVIFGPKFKKLKLKVNKKERYSAIKIILYNKQKAISIINNIENSLEIPSTKTVMNILNQYKINVSKKTLVIVTEKSLPLKLSLRNLKNVKLIGVTELNVFNLLKAKQIILTQNAFLKLKEKYEN